MAISYCLNFSDIAQYYVWASGFIPTCNIVYINILSFTAEHQLEELMDKLMTLQKSLLLANPESEHVVTSTTTPHKQQHKEQPLSDSLSELHHSLRSYCNEVITKWQDRTQLASGRVSSNKDFIKTNQSIVTQIDHVSINYYYYYYMYTNINMDRISWPVSTNMIPARIVPSHAISWNRSKNG